MKRKTRIRKEYVPKEDGFICGKCGAIGNCGDTKLNPKGNKLPFYWDENAGKHGKIICVSCGHWLETKKELEELINFKETQQYGFWLRFASTHFIPCNKCQDELNEILTLQTGMTLDFCGSPCIALKAYKNKNELPEFVFILSFVSPSEFTSYEFKPCHDCQGKLWHKFSEEELHIGNDVKPMVELWRSWELIEEKEEPDWGQVQMDIDLKRCKEEQ